MNPRPNSIVTLIRPVFDADGDWLPEGLDVVVLEVYEDETILANASKEKDDSKAIRASESVDVYLYDGDWEQRPEEARP